MRRATLPSSLLAMALMSSAIGAITRSAHTEPEPRTVANATPEPPPKESRQVRRAKERRLAKNRQQP